MALVEQVAGTRPQRRDPQCRLTRLLETVEEHQRHGDGRVARHRPEGRLGDDAESPRGAAHQPRQIDEAVAAQIIEPVAAVRESVGGLAGGDHRGRIGEHRVDADGQARHAGSRIDRTAHRCPGEEPGRCRLEFDDRPVGEHDLERRDPPAHRAVTEEPAAGGVTTDHPPDRRHRRGRRVGAEGAAETLEVLLELEPDDPRLDADGVAGRGDDPPQVPRAIDDHPGAKGIAGEARSGAAGMDRHAPFGGPADRGRHIVDTPRPNDDQRPNLEQAAVGGVEGARGVVAEDLPGHDPAQVLRNPLPFLIHEIPLPDPSATVRCPNQPPAGGRGASSCTRATC